VKLNAKIEAALGQTGLPWSLERGGKHHKLRVAGRLAGILPRSGHSETDQRAVLNTVTQIRRVAREVQT
jgi:hypothetical protein